MYLITALRSYNKTQTFVVATKIHGFDLKAGYLFPTPLSHSVYDKTLAVQDACEQ